MKQLPLITLLVLTSLLTYGQDQNFEKTTYYELKERASFYEVNDKYEIQKDTIFFTTSGFLILPEWDEAIIDGKIYVILTYPPFTNGKQSATETAGVKLTAGNPVRYPLVSLNGKTLCILKEEFEKISKDPIFSTRLTRWRNYQITAGQLMLPFKLRPKAGDKKFQMTTDVTIGAYGGIRKRISARNPTYITVPFVLGLSFININDNTTKAEGTADPKSGITPGWTWATGFVIQTNRLNLGFVFGKDYASGYADDWLYHGKTWYSFAIGYSFLK
jgi:hypothetical protein